MKRIKSILMLALFATSSVAGFAQEQETKYEFQPHWNLQLQGGVSHTLGEADFFDLISPAGQIGVGYQFSPVFGARLSGSGITAKGGWVYPKQTYDWHHASAALELSVNLSNAICGWNPNRLVNVSLFAGGGLNLAWGNDEAGALDTKGFELEYLWDGTKVRPVGKFGLGVDFRLNDCLSIGLEGNASVLSDKFNSKKAGNADWHFNALAGVKINLGKSYKKVVPVAPVVEKPVEQPAPQPAPKKVETPKPQPAPVVKKVEPLRRDVFFELNSYVIRESEAKKIAEIAEYMKANGNVKLTITGYADVQTGNEKINEGLSKNRSEVVAKELVEKYGIAADRIQTAHKGDTVQPFSVNEQNRVAVCITEAK